MKLDGFTLVDGPPLDVGKFTVIIGANDTGKSTFLREIFSDVAGLPIGQAYRRKWIASVGCSFPNEEFCRESLHRSLGIIEEGNKTFYYSGYARDFDGQPIKPAKQSKFKEEEADGILGAEDLTGWAAIAKMRHPFIAYANCDSRLAIQSPTSLQHMRGMATDILNILFRRKSLFEEIKKEVKARFEYELSLLNHDRSHLELGVSAASPPDYMSADDLVQAWRETQEWQEEFFTRINDAGHGLRSAVCILGTLLDPTSTVKLIDEPELHLYPAQKLWLGKKISEITSTTDAQTIVVTHDAHILQGMLDYHPPQLQIFRFYKAGSQRKILSWNPAGQTTRANATRAEFLAGLFHDYCIGVEGETDRLFYDEMSAPLEAFRSVDVNFVPCKGEGGAATLADLCSAVKMPVAFILDLDVVLEKPSSIRNIIRKHFGDRDLPRLDALTTEIAADTRHRHVNWKQATGYSGREGVDAQWRGTGQNGQLLRDALAELEGFGIFIVPGGSLESWDPDQEDKTRFPETAPEHIRSEPQLLEKVETFLSKVGRYLTEAKVGLAETNGERAA